MVFIILYLPIKIVCININIMKNDTSLKTMVLAIVLAMHGGLIAWAWKMQPQTETVNTENLTFVDLNALEVGSDGGDGAAAGAQGLAAAPPPKKETEPTPVAPPPPPAVPNRPPPPEQRIPPKKISRPKPQAVEEPKINTVERDDKPADIIQQPKMKAIEKPKSIEKIKPLEKPIEKIKPLEKPIEKIKPAEKPIEKPVEKPKPQIDEAKLAAERAERIAAEKAAAEKAAAEKAAQNAARAAAEKAAREAATGNGNDSSSNNRSGSINGGKNGIAGGEGRTGNASNPKGKGVGDGDGDHSKGKNKGNGNGGDGNKSSSKGGIADGGVISRPAPEYPAASIENEEEGTVSIEIIVEANGSVSSARIAKSSGHNRLDNAALRAFKAGRYKPKSDDGTPIRTRFIVKTNFSLNE